MVKIVKVGCKYKNHRSRKRNNGKTQLNEMGYIKVVGMVFWCVNECETVHQ